VASAAFVLLKDHDAKAALPALRYVTKEYPKVASYQVWLGQALGQTGDRAGARAAYCKAAELFPGDESAGNNRRAYKYMMEKGLKDLGPPEPPKDR
jgi:Flp pilus assembly protein TadD